MSGALKFVPPRVDFLDSRTGKISREWYMFLQGVFTRIGGAEGFSTTDLSESLFEDAGSGETNAMVFDLERAAGQMPPQEYCVPDLILAELSALRELVAEQNKEIDALKQAPSM